MYPTETLYALGCDARNLAAVSRVLWLKVRPENKPMPVVVGDLNGLARIAPGGLSEDFQALGRAFWPGPLSVLLHTGSRLAPAVRDAQGYTSVRITAHPLAQALCLKSGAPLVATSANVSGAPATADPAELDLGLTAQADGLLLAGPRPAGGAGLHGGGPAEPGAPASGAGRSRTRGRPGGSGLLYHPGGLSGPIFQLSGPSRGIFNKSIFLNGIFSAGSLDAAPEGSGRTKVETAGVGSGPGQSAGLHL